MDNNTQWIQLAACKKKTALFFPPEEEMKRANIVYRNAKAICKDCPVTEQCLQYALREEMYFGVWGGTTPKERQAMFRHNIYSKK